jgi:hypothetical protein
VPFLAARSAAFASDPPSPASVANGNDIVVYRGWVLRRDDLAQVSRNDR